MWCNQIFSLLSLTNEEDKEYTIQNIIVCDNYETASQIARAAYGDAAIAADTTQYALSVGYTYKNGEYYDNGGAVIMRNPTESENIRKLEQQLADVTENEADLLYELSSIQLGIELGEEG